MHHIVSREHRVTGHRPRPAAQEGLAQSDLIRDMRSPFVQHVLQSAEQPLQCVGHAGESDGLESLLIQLENHDVPVVAADHATRADPCAHMNRRRRAHSCAKTALCADLP